METTAPYEGREYLGINEVVGPLFMIENIHNVGYNELVEIVDVPPQYPLLNGMIRKKCRYRLTIHQPDAHGRPQRSTGMNA